MSKLVQAQSGNHNSNGKSTDIRCFLNLEYKSHYLFKNVSEAFNAEANNTWESHDTKITDPFTVQFMYKIMADSEKGPMIAMHRNAICTQFPLDPNHTESV